MSILLVEDNLVNQKVAQLMLGKLGYRVAIANNGLEAIEMFQKGADYDLVYMDCHMPEMDGFDATRSIRELEAQEQSPKSIPIVALTANVEKGIRQKCLDAGMDDYMSKPFNVDGLRNNLERWLAPTA